jgi:hypothetical protein
MIYTEYSCTTTGVTPKQIHPPFCEMGLSYNFGSFQYIFTVTGKKSFSGYARAEVDRVVVKDADNFEYRQELEYR